MSQQTTGTSDNSPLLLQKIKANDDAALNQLYRDNYARIAQYIIRNNGTSDDAKDIYQEAFLAAWRNIQMDKFKPLEETSLSGYIFRIAQFKWRDHLRSQGRTPLVTMQDNDIADETGNDLRQEEYLQKLNLHYNLLGKECQELLKRFYFLKDSLRKIASHFSWTEATAKNNKYRCLQKLRNLILKEN